MIDNLIFSLNGTVPLFVIMMLGYILHRVGFLSEEFVAQANKFVFNVTLPVLLFHDLAVVDIRSEFDGPFVLYCTAVTIVSIAAIWILARLLMRKSRNLVGEFVQGSYRSSAAILGAAFIQNIYGSVGMSGLMLLGCVPFYNCFAVIILLLESPSRPAGLTVGQNIVRSLKGIVTNPIILGLLLGTVAGLCRMPMPSIVDKSLTGVASLTTPLALIAIGAGFRGRAALSQVRLASIATFIKLILLPAVFLPIAVRMGFTDQKLVAIIVMLGSITTPTSYIMAKNMGHDGTLTASICVLTTLLSAFTLTFWLFLYRSLGYLS